ncbi:MAG: prepilin-type N-terminal cleavage/methylation domain-containing protein [Planctomycetota bacterium]
MRTNRTHVLGRARRAFTLVEILIVVVILGILAAVVVPSFANAVEPSRHSAFATSMRAFAQAMQFYRAENGAWPEDGTSGEAPAGTEDLLDIDAFESITPIGGVWDTESDPAGLGYGVGVVFNGEGESRDSEYMLLIDELIDDGDLTSGGFMEFPGDRFYMVLVGD